MKLFEPGKIGKLSLKNRIAMSPIDIGSLGKPDGRLSQQSIDFYIARAKGGTGLIITSIPFTPQIELNQLAEAVHDYGTKIAFQVWAGPGRAGGAGSIAGKEAVAPSALPCFRNPNVIARALTTEEVEQLAQSFQFIAEMIRDAGIDAIDLSCHAGYLVDEFMTALWNKRSDKYGGDLEGRLRFPLEIIEAIKRGAGADFPIILRFGLTHYLEGGREVDEGLEIARRLEAAGVAALDITAGCYETFYWVGLPTTQPPGCNVILAEMAKKVVNIPVMAVGKLGYPELAERVLQEGKADFIILGRALFADPEWPNKVKEGRLEDVRPCIGDHEGCWNRPKSGKRKSCTVNPAAGTSAAR